jgi:NitT/TauT family transport system substrate-binding protein
MEARCLIGLHWDRLSESLREKKTMNMLLSVLVAAAVVLQSLHVAQAADKIRVGVTNPNLSFLPSRVAVKRGFFKEEGIEAEVIRMRVPVMITAISTGDLDYTMVFGSVVRAATRGLPVRVVASLLEGSTHALVSQPELKSVKELKGKSLGIESHGSTADVAGRMMLKHFGVDPDKEIKFLALGPDQARLAALREKLVQGVVVAAPADVEAQKMGFNILSRAYEIFTFPFIGVGTSVRKIRERPDEVKRVIRAFIKANRFIRQNRDETIQILVEWGQAEPRSAASAYDSAIKVFSPDGTIPADGLRLVIEQAKKEAGVTRDVSSTEVSDVAILR